MKSNKMTPQSSIHDGKFEDWIGPEFYYKEPQNTGTLLYTSPFISLEPEYPLSRKNMV